VIIIFELFLSNLSKYFIEERNPFCDKICRSLTKASDWAFCVCGVMNNISLLLKSQRSAVIVDQGKRTENKLNAKSSSWNLEIPSAYSIPSSAKTCEHPKNNQRWLCRIMKHYTYHIDYILLIQDIPLVDSKVEHLHFLSRYNLLISATLNVIFQWTTFIAKNRFVLCIHRIEFMVNSSSGATISSLVCSNKRTMGTRYIATGFTYYC
jgi:hypothetical protein